MQFVNTRFKVALSLPTSERARPEVVKRARERMKRGSGVGKNKAVNQRNKTNNPMQLPLESNSANSKILLILVLPNLYLQLCRNT